MPNQLTQNSPAKSPVKEFLIDIFALNSFSYVVGFVIEIFISQMSFAEHLQVRLIALILNSIVARPFTLWRDFIINKLKISKESTFFQHYVCDTLAFLSFQLPLYVGNMMLGEVNLEAIIKAAATISLVAGLLGRPYGIYLDWLRKKFALTQVPTQEVKG